MKAGFGLTFCLAANLSERQGRLIHERNVRLPLKQPGAPFVAMEYPKLALRSSEETCPWSHSQASSYLVQG